MKNLFEISRIVLVVSLSCMSLSATAYIAPELTTDSPDFFHPPIHIKPTAPFNVATGLKPQQILKAYGFDTISHQGEGQTIAIINANDDPNIEADLNVFNTMFDLPACTTENGCFAKIYADGKQPQADNGWSLEMALDVEWAHAIAPKAKILLVEASNASLPAMLQAISVGVKNGANIVSMSWGGKEFSFENIFDFAFMGQDVAFVAASGDSGNGSMWPAASPFVISVGGTTLSTDEAGNYLGETAWKGSGGGVSGYEKIPDFQSNYPIPKANGYRGIPDVAFNADPNSGFSVYSSLAFKGRSGWFVVGGTSAGAPVWAALLAIANSAAGKSVASHEALYNVAKTDYDHAYNDIKTGSNGSCGYYCDARKNYDYVTGLGTPKVKNFISLLSH